VHLPALLAFPFSIPAPGSSPVAAGCWTFSQSRLTFACDLLPEFSSHASVLRNHCYSAHDSGAARFHTTLNGMSTKRATPADEVVRRSRVEHQEARSATAAAEGVSAAAASLPSAAHSLFPVAANDELRAIRRSLAQSAVHAVLPAIFLTFSTPLEEKWLAFAALLQEDMARPDGPLLDLSHIVEGKKPLLLFLYDRIGELSAGSFDWLVPKRKQHKAAAFATFQQVVPLICTLIRSGYDGSLKFDGRNALQMLCKQFSAKSADDWVYKFAEALLDRGCDVNARDSDSRTPLLNWCSKNVPDVHFRGPLLLLERGADIDARDNNGFTAVHCLVERGNLSVLRELAEHGWLLVANLTLQSNDGETAFEFADRLLARYNGSEWDGEIVGERDCDKAVRVAICDLLRSTKEIQEQRVRPHMRRLLAHSLLPPNLADIVLDYASGQEQRKGSFFRRSLGRIVLGILLVCLSLGLNYQ